MKNNISLKRTTFLFIIVFIFLLGYFVPHLFSKTYRTNSFFRKVQETMEKKYPFQEPTEKEKLYGVIEGFVSSYGDEHSLFLPPRISKQFHQDVSGSFAGVGVGVFPREGGIVITQVLKNSPAEKAGIHEGDYLLKVDGRDIATMTFSELISRMRGEKGTIVHLTLRDPKTKKIFEREVERDTIKIPVLETEERDGVFIISFHNFNRKSIDEFKRALELFTQKRDNYLLIDLRGNPGGYLSEAIDFLSYFVPRGEILVQEDFGDSGREREVSKSKGFSFLNGKKFKLGILIDRESASASEIVASAIRELKKGIIIGERSFGKGSVQELIDFDDGSSLKVTIGKWLTPKGKSIPEDGIQPDREINDMPFLTNDEVLSEAVSILKES